VFAFAKETIMHRKRGQALIGVLFATLLLTACIEDPSQLSETTSDQLNVSQQARHRQRLPSHGSQHQHRHHRHLVPPQPQLPSTHHHRQRLRLQNKFTGRAATHSVF
jgi:hypothetical protein